MTNKERELIDKEHREYLVDFYEKNIMAPSSGHDLFILGLIDLYRPKYSRFNKKRMLDIMERLDIRFQNDLQKIFYTGMRCNYYQETTKEECNKYDQKENE